MFSRILTSLTLVTLSTLAAAFGQAQRPSLSCESSPEVKKALDEAAKQRALLPFAEGLARYKQALEGLLAKHPQDLDVHVARINTGRYEDLDNWPDSYLREADRRPKW